MAHEKPGAFGASDYGRVQNIGSTGSIDLTTAQPQSNPQEHIITGEFLAPTIDSTGEVFVRLGSPSAKRFPMRAGSYVSGELERRVFLDWIAQPDKFVNLLFGEGVIYVPGAVSVFGKVNTQDVFAAPSEEMFSAGFVTGAPAAGQRAAVALQGIPNTSAAKNVEIVSIKAKVTGTAGPSILLNRGNGAFGAGDSVILGEQHKAGGPSSEAMELRLDLSKSSIVGDFWLEYNFSSDTSPYFELVEGAPLVIERGQDTRFDHFIVTTSVVDKEFAINVYWREFE